MGMLSPIVSVLLAIAGTSLSASEPSLVDSGATVGSLTTPIEATTTPLPSLEVPRADPSTQLLYSSLGGGLGILGGGFLGGSIGAALSPESDGWAAIGNVFFGIALGTLAGGTTGATWGAVAARPRRSDRSFAPTAMGALGGLFLGFAAGATAYGAFDADGSAAGTLLFLAIPALGAGAGATIVDQWTTPRRISGLPSNSKLGMAPWMPRDGLVGLRLSIPTGL